MQGAAVIRRAIGGATPRFVVLSALIGAACAGDSRPAAMTTTAAMTATASATTAASPAAAPPAPVAALEPAVAEAVEKVLTAAEHPGLTWASIGDVSADLKPLYDAEADRLLWFNGSAPLATVERTVSTLAAAGDHGLDPADYDAASLKEQWAGLEAGSAAATDRAMFDLALSVAAARMLRAVHIGRVDPATMHWGYQLERKPVDAPVLLREAREGRGLAAMLDSLQPPFAHYARARTTLAAYKALAAQGEPPPIPELGKGPGIKPAGIWAGVPRSPRACACLAICRPTRPKRPVSQPATRARWSMPSNASRIGTDSKTDGVIGAGTIKALNVTLAQRVQQIELAMERMRWLPKLDDRPNVFVNVPLFRCGRPIPFAARSRCG